MKRRNPSPTPRKARRAASAGPSSKPASSIRSEFTAPLAASTNKLWSAHVVVPSRIVERLPAGSSRRVVCTLNGRATIQCAIVAYRRDQWVVTVNQSLRRTLRLSVGDPVHVSVTPDESTYGHPMPAELAEAMKQDPEGRSFFGALTLGRQRTLLYIVNAVKDPARRAWRAAVILRHLRQNSGTLHYRQLAEQLKSVRSRH